MSRQPKQDNGNTEHPGYLHTPQKQLSRTPSTRNPTTVGGSPTSVDPGSLSKSPRSQELGKLSARQNSNFFCKNFGSESRLSRPHRGNLREASNECFERNNLGKDPIGTTSDENPRKRPASAINPIYRQPSTQPYHKLEMWIRRPPNRVAPTTAAPVTARVTIPVHPAPGTARELVARYPTEGISPTTTHWKTPGANVALPEIAIRHPGETAPSPSDNANARFPIPGSPSKRTTAANSRNLARIQSANVNDQITLGESRSNRPTEGEATKKNTTNYLQTDVNSFLPEEVQGPDDSFTPPAWFLKAIRTIAQTNVPTPTKPPFKFEATAEAAEHNGKILAQAGFDVLGRVLKAHQLSTLGYGCEFRPPDQLEPLLGRHRHFSLLRDLLTEGMSCYFYKVKLTEEERAEELEAILARGNHESAKVESNHVSNLLAKDVTHGFSVPIPIDVIRATDRRSGGPVSWHGGATDPRRGRQT